MKFRSIHHSPSGDLDILLTPNEAKDDNRGTVESNSAVSDVLQCTAVGTGDSSINNGTDLLVGA